MATSLLSFFFQFAMGRMLPEVDFGTLNALLSFSSVLAVPFAIMAYGSAKYTAEFMAQKKPENAKFITMRLMRMAFYIGVFLFLMLTIFNHLFAEMLNIENSLFIVSIGIMIVFSGVSSVLLGVLQGYKRFITYGIVPLLSILVRFIVSVLLIHFGYGLNEILLFLFLSIVIPILYSRYKLKDYFKLEQFPPDNYNPKAILTFLGSTFFVHLCVSFFMNSDILLIKAFNTTTDFAGVYSSGMQICKGVVYIASAIAAVVFPMTAEKAAKGSDTRPLFLKAILLSGGVATIGAVGINLFGSFFIKLIFGERYLSVVPMLLPMSIFAVCLTLLTILLNYSIALGRLKFFSFSILAGGVLLIPAILLFHTTVVQILLSLTVSLVMISIINISYALYRK